MRRRLRRRCVRADTDVLRTEGRRLTLQDVCDTIFGGRIKVATLRAEIERGNLTVFRVGRCHFTTAAMCVR